MGLSQEKAHKGGELYLGAFRSSDSKGNSNEFALGEGWGRGQVPPPIPPSTSPLSYFNSQNQTVGKQFGILTLLINLLKLFCGPEEDLPRTFQLTQKKKKNQRKSLIITGQRLSPEVQEPERFPHLPTRFIIIKRIEIPPPILGFHHNLISVYEPAVSLSLVKVCSWQNFWFL